MFGKKDKDVGEVRCEHEEKDVVKERLDRIEEVLRQAECPHVEWEYEWMMPCPLHLLATIFTHGKRCKSCGKLEKMTHERWLEEQAEIHYKKHEDFMERLNALIEEQETGEQE